MKRNWHAIEGPNGMCACGVTEDGTVVTCGHLLEDEIAAQLALLEAQQTAQTWQPIESAPKDGTAILVAYRLKAGASTGNVCVGESCWHQGGYWFQIDESGVLEVTHWMPLPPAPSPKEPQP